VILEWFFAFYNFCICKMQKEGGWNKIPLSPQKESATFVADFLFSTVLKIHLS